MKTIEQLAEIVLDRCATVTGNGAPTQRFRIASGTWFIRDRGDGQWIALEDPATLVRAALLRHCASVGLGSAPTAERAYDEEIVAKVIKYLATFRSPRNEEYCFDAVLLAAEPDRLDYLTAGRGKPI